MKRTNTFQPGGQYGPTIEVTYTGGTTISLGAAVLAILGVVATVGFFPLGVVLFFLAWLRQSKHTQSIRGARTEAVDAAYEKWQAERDIALRSLR